jgi:hypothetical protein
MNMFDPESGSPSSRNRIINGNFAVNQRAVSGTVTLAAGAYGHDRWKAGASGCTYTFATSGNDTIITITAGSLMQVVEDRNVEGGVYSLSHAGTAQARMAINGAATSGSYAAATQVAPLLTSSATGNQAITVEFSTGTVNRVQLEPGRVVTPFERRHIGHELALCQRYYETGSFGFNGAYQAGGNGCSLFGNFRVTKRTTPTVATSSVVAANLTSPAFTPLSTEAYSFGGLATTTGVTVYYGTFAASAEL